jgi:hypothetical protein
MGAAEQITKGTLDGSLREFDGTRTTQAVLDL